MEAKQGVFFLYTQRILLVICLIFTNLESLSQIRKAPEWVRSIPIAEDAFYGVGVIEKSQNDSYRAKARTMALKEIIEKIFISVSSNSELTMTYENKETAYYLDETVSIESSNYLSGHQKVDEWTDNRSDTYYVLFKLDYEVYKENRKRYFEILEDVIQVISTEAGQLFSIGEISRGVNKLTDALSRIDAEIKKIVEPEYLVSLQKWQLSTLYELETQISRIGFRLESNYDFCADEQRPLVISEFIVDQVTGTPLSGLSISLKVMKGDVFNHSFDHYIADNAVGIYGLFPERQVAMIQIVAELPLSDQIKSMIDPTISNAFISKPIALTFNPYKISYNVPDVGKYSFWDSDSVHPLRRITNDLGLIETGSDEAFYEIELVHSDQTQRLSNGNFDVNLELKIVITRMRDNRELYHFSLPKARTTSPNYESAMSQAFDDVFKSALDDQSKESEQFLVTFITFLCSQHP